MEYESDCTDRSAWTYTRIFVRACLCVRCTQTLAILKLTWCDLQFRWFSLLSPCESLFSRHSQTLPPTHTLCVSFGYEKALVLSEPLRAIDTNISTLRKSFLFCLNLHCDDPGSKPPIFLQQRPHSVSGKTFISHISLMYPTLVWASACSALSLFHLCFCFSLWSPSVALVLRSATQFRLTQRGKKDCESQTKERKK